MGSGAKAIHVCSKHYSAFHKRGVVLGSIVVGNFKFVMRFKSARFSDGVVVSWLLLDVARAVGMNGIFVSFLYCGFSHVFPKVFRKLV